MAKLLSTDGSIRGSFRREVAANILWFESAQYKAPLSEILQFNGEMAWDAKVFSSLDNRNHCPYGQN
jgi:hypothetical protein